LSDIKVTNEFIIIDFKYVINKNNGKFIERISWRNDFVDFSINIIIGNEICNISSNGIIMTYNLEKNIWREIKDNHVEHINNPKKY